MANHITGIDHALIAVRDLAAAAAAFTRLGFTLTPRGGHPEWGTANHCLMFPDDYVELLAAIGPGPMAETVAGQLAGPGEGLMALAFGTDDGATAGLALRAAGHQVEVPRALSRALDTPEGPVKALFAIVTLPPAATPGVSAVLCQHLTPGLLRRPAWLDHPNGALGIASLTAVVDDPEAAARPYDLLFGAGNSTPTDSTLTVHTGRGLLFLCLADQLTQLHPEADLDEGGAESGALVAMAVRVRDTDAAAALLTANGVAFSRDTEGTIRIRPADACGVYLEFTR